MKKMYANYLTVCLLLLASVGASAQKSDDGGKKKGKTQNQLQYLKPDMDQKDWNYDDRVNLTQPEMPRYDLNAGEAPYQDTKKKKKQQEAFKNNDYYYPAKPKNQWELGLGVGSFLISGDVKPDINPLKSYGATFSLRKSLGYVFSLRLQYVYGHAVGRDWEPKFNSSRNPVLNGSYDANIDYVHNAPNSQNNQMFHNYMSQVHEVSLQGVITLGNLLFHRERNKVNFYTMLGVGGMLYNTKINALDADGNMYDYTDALNAYSATYEPSTFFKKPRKKAVNAVLKDMYDKTYETAAESHITEGDNEERIKNYTFNPVYSLGFGLGFHMSKRVTLNLETRISMTNDDLLDGQRFQEDFNQGGGGGALTRDFDNYYYTFLTLNVHLGKKSLEPMWWLNPMDYTYKRLAEADPEKAINDLLQDDDKDGVPNRLDQELDTKEGCPVDPKGIALDSDKDGLKDCEDDEPFSPPGYPINARGVAQVPCCADNNAKKGGYDCTPVDLPNVVFDDDKYYIAPEYYAHMHTIAEKLQMCPDAKVYVTGINTRGKYSEQLAWNRVNAAINYLKDNYGLSCDRFIVKFQEDESKATTAAEKKLQRRVEFRMAQDGESGDCNPPAPHPGMNAGSDK